MRLPKSSTPIQADSRYQRHSQESNDQVTTAVRTDGCQETNRIEAENDEPSDESTQ